FCFQLEQLSSSGVPLVDALVDLRDSTENARLREVVSGVVESIQGGASLSQAMTDYPSVFSPVFSSLIRAGETTGRLPEVLKSLAESLKWEDELAAQTKKLIMYPAFVGSIVIMVTFFVDYWWAMLLAPVAVAVLVTMLAKTNPLVRYQLDRLKLTLPYLGNILRKIILSRFASTFALMYASGITILEAIRSSEETAGNLVIQEGLRLAGQQIADGKNVTAAFQEVGLFPPLVVRMLRVGEATGGLD